MGKHEPAQIKAHAEDVGRVSATMRSICREISKDQSAARVMVER